MTGDEQEYAAAIADDDFEAVYELMLRIAAPGDDPLRLANECWSVRCALRDHIVAHYAPKQKHEIH
jgi:hypothetical protein